MNLIDFRTLIPFALITIFTPGPGNLTSASMGINFGIKKTMYFLYGIFLGFFILMLFSGFFSNLLFVIFPSIEPIMRWVGAMYIFYLAFSTFKTTLSLEKNKNSSVLGFYNGLLLQLSNPKGIIFCLTLFSTLLRPIIDNFLFIIIFSLSLALLVFSSILTWTLFGAIINQYLRNKNVKIITSSIFSLLLIFTALNIIGFFSN